MEKDIDYVSLVKRAQLGDKECLECLTKAAERRLRMNVYRLTLEPDLTQDIVQETMLKMLKVLGELKEADRFWPWLYKIAINKIRLHHRKQQRRKSVPISAMADAARQADGRQAISNMVAEELKEVVLKAMGRLKSEHRTILTLRCYEEMRYSQIAESMGCSEFAAQMLFYRAKKALQRQLSREGFGKGLLLTALVFFGKVTAPGEAAADVSVSASAVKVGATAGLLGLVSSKTAIVCLATAGLLGAGTLVATSGPNKTMGVAVEKGAQNPQSGTAAGVAEEYWYFFPEGKDGPVMTRSMKGNSQARRYCRWMQDEEGNYYFDRSENTIYINNHRQYNADLTVWRLPTDRAHLRDFLSRAEGQTHGVEYVTGDTSGLMAVVKYDRNGSSLWATHHYHVLKEEYFRYNWPAQARVADKRDAMHKRGWTYFTAEGHIDGERVSGTGRLPFVYAAGRRHSPWLRLKVGRRLTILDSREQALVYGAGKVRARHEAGSFFKGLARPWMGLHTIDTVRRDAAEQGVRFETHLEPGEEKAEIIVTCQQGRLVYRVDMDKDVIETVALSTSDGREGELRFFYLQDIGEEGDEFVEPRTTSQAGRTAERPGILWPIKLITDYGTDE
ncbi:MAG: RNA polymerase sigma factor [Planctomycetota bacterium]|jgi:RNA polymerase sigma-70 factor (ECF subfamily)